MDLSVIALLLTVFGMSFGCCGLISIYVVEEKVNILHNIVIVITTILCFGIVVYNVEAKTKDDFTVVVITPDGYAREFDGVAYVPFDIEFKLLLKNNTARRCSARVFIDGARVSPAGDFVIDAGDKLELERFVVDDLDKGKRFKFVPLDNPKVDDPTRKENGIVRVEFRYEEIPLYPIFDQWYYNYDSGATFSTTTIPTSNGATIPGSESDQKFRKVDYDFEDEIAAEIQLQLVGLTDIATKFIHLYDSINNQLLKMEETLSNGVAK